MLLIKLAVVFFAFFVCILAGEIDLTDNDFSTRIGEAETTLVMFYAPW